MAAITHRHDEFHRGLVPEDQLADDTPTAGFVVTATGGGEAEWALAASAPITSWKEPVRAATVAAGTLATAYEDGDTVDGVVLATGDRILLKDQASAPANGVYTVNASGAPTRATDFDTSAEALGAVILVLEGTNADRVFILTTDAPFTIGSDSLDFAELGLPDIESLPTTETDPTLVLGPDGSGGVEFRPEVVQFQWEFYKSGVLAVLGDVAAYFRTPFAVAIDSVVVHVATAPLVQAIIIDVNDDGTTIFTTQGNRPSIAAGANDDTSGDPDGGTSVAANSVITVDVDQVGIGTLGSDLAVFVRGHSI